MKKIPRPLMTIGLLLGWIILLSCLGIVVFNLYKSLTENNDDIATLFFMAILSNLRAIFQLGLFTHSKWKEFQNA